MKRNIINHSKRISSITNNYAVFLNKVWELQFCNFDKKIKYFRHRFCKTKLKIQKNKIKTIFWRSSWTSSRDEDQILVGFEFSLGKLSKLFSANSYSWIKLAMFNASTTTINTNIGKYLIVCLADICKQEVKQILKHETTYIFGQLPFTASPTTHIHQLQTHCYRCIPHSSCHFGKYFPNFFFTRSSGTFVNTYEYLTLQAFFSLHFTALADGLRCMQNRRMFVYPAVCTTPPTRISTWRKDTKRKLWRKMICDDFISGISVSYNMHSNYHVYQVVVQAYNKFGEVRNAFAIRTEYKTVQRSYLFGTKHEAPDST